MPLASFDLSQMNFEDRPTALARHQDAHRVWEQEQRLAALLACLAPPPKVRPGRKESPLEQIAINAAISLRAEGKRVTAPAVRRRIEINGTIVPYTNRRIQDWIKPFRK
jgi:hypothetical protein